MNNHHQQLSNHSHSSSHSHSHPNHISNHIHHSTISTSNHVEKGASSTSDRNTTPSVPNSVTNSVTISDETNQDPKARKMSSPMYSVQKNRKIVRVLTVLAYMIVVSLGAIVLSLYYIFLWKPKMQAINSTVAIPNNSFNDPNYRNSHFNGQPSSFNYSLYNSANFTNFNHYYVSHVLEKSKLNSSSFAPKHFFRPSAAKNHSTQISYPTASPSASSSPSSSLNTSLITDLDNDANETVSTNSSSNSQSSLIFNHISHLSTLKPIAEVMQKSQSPSNIDHKSDIQSDEQSMKLKTNEISSKKGKDSAQ